MARAHIFAAEKPSGQEYILSERTAGTAEWLGMACELAGVRMPPMLPSAFARLFLGAEETIANWRKRRPMLPRETIAHLVHGFQVDGSKAARELRLTYTPMNESLRAAITWYWEKGLLRKKPACVA